MNTNQPKTCDLLVIPCSGQSYLGCLTVSAAGRLAQENKAVTLAFNELSDSDVIRKAIDDADRSITVDGCEKTCMSNRLKDCRCETEFHLILTEMGLENMDEAKTETADLELAKDAILAAATRVSARHPVIPGCCC